MTEPSRFVVGIDLGTTNSAIAYIDTAEGAEEPAVHDLPIPQLITAGEVSEEALLPSFLYLPAEGEIAPAELALPWAKEMGYAVGKFAREFGAQVPTRLVSSAKSWLCHPGIDRRGPVLPYVAEATFPKISPLEAQIRILKHLASAWNHSIAARDKSRRLEHQDVVLTVPASFDAEARDLTVEAAKVAGLERLTLFEEPQAAFYAWLHNQQAGWRKQIRPGDVVLVLDVGGGTTDFTLIGVGEEAGDLTLNRIAVGDHLLLGGDNMDLALAHSVAAQLKQAGQKIDSHQLLGLWHSARVAKERLFENPKTKSQPVTVLGRGRKVVGGAIRAELSRETLEEVLIEGFLPMVPHDGRPKAAAALGLQELGLSYAADPAITKHLAGFLAKHHAVMDEYRPAAVELPLPNAVLFNGGVFQAATLRNRVLEQLVQWSNAGPNGTGAIRELATSSLDRAVAVGAAVYGLVRRGHGVRIRGGVGRSYYIGIEVPRPAVPGMEPPIKALCVVPQGMEEGTEAELANQEFGLVVGAPVTFRFLGSSERRQDQLGTGVLDWEDSISELAPLSTTLPVQPGLEPGQVVPVKLLSKVTEVGTLELWCQTRDGNQRWKLEFRVRDPGE